MIAEAFMALALVPSGFTAQPALSSRASVVAGKPVTVYCANTWNDWGAFISTLSSSAVSGDAANGVTPVVGGTETYIGPSACFFLLGKLRGGPLYPSGFGRSVLTLTHEAEHLRGVTSESEAECTALYIMPGLLKNYWGIKSAKNVSRVMAGARASHARTTPEYHGSCG